MLWSNTFPQDRQTLMFSATQTKRVSDLARLSLKEPEFVSVHEAADSATPSTLQQNYVVTPLPEKLDTLWSFIRANVKKKILVFLSSGKQVRFVYEAFRHLQPGLPLLHLHGRQKQTARLEISTKFSNSKHACLFSTDVAARGLDFPAVDWVVQVDAPEDTDTYIHRVGRTARFEHEGHAVMFLDPSEEPGMLAALEKKKVVLEKINVRQKKMQQTIRSQLQNMCFKDPELKYLGQKAFVSYVRSVHIQKDKEIFNLKKLDLEGLAASMGLPGAPRVKFVKGEDAKARKNAPRQLLAALEGSNDESDAKEDEKPKKTERNGGVRTKYDRMFERQNQGVLSEHYMKLIEEDGGGEVEDSGSDADERGKVSDGGDDFLSVKRRFEAGDSDLDQNNDSGSDSESGASSRSSQPQSSKPKATTNDQKIKTIQLSTAPSASPLTIDSNRRSKLLTSRKALLKYKGRPTHLTFSDDSDTPHDKKAYQDEKTFTKADEERRVFLEKEAERAREADVLDKEVARGKRREKIGRRKDREGAERDGRGLGREEQRDGDGEVGVQLVPYDEADEPVMDADGDGDANERPVPKVTAKRQKKWFEDASSNDEDEGTHQKEKSKKAKKRQSGEDDQPQTLEDLEAMASGLLAGS